MSIASAKTEFDALSPEQAKMAQKMLNMMDRTESRFFATVSDFNGQADMEARQFDYDKASYHVKVARGDTIEKGAYMTGRMTAGDPPFLPEPLWHRYMEIDVHPKTPLIGQLHATIHFAYNADDSSVIAGYMDYTPAAWIDEDNAQLKQVVDELFQRATGETLLGLGQCWRRTTTRIN